MKRITPIKLFKIIICCILAWICFIVCVETDNTTLFVALVPVAVMIILAYLLFDKLNRIIKLLQEMVNYDNETK